MNDTLEQHDEFGGTVVEYTFDHWDGHSALLDPKTKRVVALVGSLQLLAQDIELAILNKVVAKGAKMICNGAPATRKWHNRTLLQNSLCSEL